MWDGWQVCIHTYTRRHRETLIHTHTGTHIHTDIYTTQYIIIITFLVIKHTDITDSKRHGASGGKLHLLDRLQICRLVLLTLSLQ